MNRRRAEPIWKRQAMAAEVAKIVKKEKYKRYFYYFVMATAVYNFILFALPR